MTLPTLLAHVAARWAVTRTPTHGWAPDESETEMNETINDFETALDTWDMVTDANGMTWIRDENECVRHWVIGAFWARPKASQRPTPPFTNAYETEEA